MPEASIVILTKNAENVIDESLKSIFTQEVDFDFEVIVIDSGSRDKTVEIIKNYPVDLIQIPAREFGHGKTRNLGASLAKGRYIVFLNGDAIPKNKYWLKNLFSGFLLYEKVAGIYSRISPRQDCNPLETRDILCDDYLFSEKVKYITSFSNFNEINPERKRKLISFHTISCAIEKSALSENPFADIQFGEDLEWSERMLEKGYKIIFEPRSEVIHSHNLHRSFIRVMKRYYDDAKFNQIFLKRWTFLGISKLPLVFILKSIRDFAYILNLKKNLSYKLTWIVYSPIMRLAEVFGILLAISPHISAKLATKLSLVEEIKQR